MTGDSRRELLPDPYWLDGRLLETAPGTLPDVAERALANGSACYTTALVRAGSPVWGERHVRRLRRDSAALGLGDVDEALVLDGLSSLARARFGGGEGIVRIVAMHTALDGSAIAALHLLGEAREVGDDPEQWEALQAPFPHTTRGPWTGAKGSNLALYERARTLMAEAAVQEVLLADAEGFVIEGCRSNVFVVDADDALVAPNISRGAVAGIAQELVHERLEVVVRDVAVTELAQAREIIAVNAVRQACPVIRLERRPVGSGGPGPWYQRIAEALAREP